MILKVMITLSFTLLLSLFAETTQVDTKETPVYQKALELFKDKKYIEAENELIKLSDSNSDNEQINFLLGRTKFELKKYEEAYIYYDRVLIQNPENDRARLEMARVFAEMKSYDEAKEQLELVLARPIPDKVRKNVESFLESIEQMRKKHFISGAVIVGIGYDSNVNNTTDQTFLFDDTTAFTINKNTHDTKEDNDIYHREIVALNHTYVFPSKEWTYDTQLIGFAQTQKDHSEKNVVYTGLTTGPSYIQKLYKISLPISVDKLWYGSEGLLYTYGISPNISYKLDQNTLLNSKIKLNKKKYVKSVDKVKDSNILELSLSMTKKLTPNDVIIPSFTTGKERATGSPHSDVDKNYYSVGLGYIRTLSKTLGLKLNYSYQRSNYKQLRAVVAGFQFPLQRDKLETLGIELIKQYDKTMVGSFGYSYTQNNSNNNDRSYDKYNLTYNHTWVF